MPLSDTSVRQAKPADKEYTMADGLGLSLLVRPNGKHWVFRYTYQGTRKKMFLGTYPEVPLKQARIKRDEARATLENGGDPNAPVQGTIEAVPELKLFKDVAQEWVAFRSPRLTQGRQGSAAQAQRYLGKDILPMLGERPIVEIKRKDVLAVIRRVETRGALNVAEKVRTWLHQIFRFAILHDYVEVNPATDLDMLAAEQPPVKHNPHLDLTELGEFVRDMRNYRGSLLIGLGVQLLLLTGVRTIELRSATHDQFDLKKGIWTIPASRVKQLRKLAKLKGSDVPDYLVPLSTQAIEIVKQIRTFTHQYELLLPGRNDPTKTISENTLNTAIKRMGYEGKLTGHGIRGSLSTALYELEYPGNWIEAQLSHADENKSRDAYNHALYVEQRRGMMQNWADLLDWLAKQTQPFDPATIARYQPASSERSSQTA